MQFRYVQKCFLFCFNQLILFYLFLILTVFAFNTNYEFLHFFVFAYGKETLKHLLIKFSHALTVTPFVCLSVCHSLTSHQHQRWWLLGRTNSCSDCVNDGASSALPPFLLCMFCLFFSLFLNIVGIGGVLAAVVVVDACG